MLQNARITAFTISDLSRENQQEEGVGGGGGKSKILLGLKANYLLSKILKILCGKFCMQKPGHNFSEKLFRNDLNLIKVCMLRYQF